jgi:glycosyltransferase involved in cell wall biosynthesis
MHKVTLAGHPFASTGMGQQFRSHFAACRAVGIDARLFDIFGNVAREDNGLAATLEPLETQSLGDGVRIFHINGDEVEAVLEQLYKRQESFKGGLNVVVPAWELQRYPAPWARQLKRFDEVWALSRLIKGALASAGVDSHLVSQPVETEPGPFLPRRFFGIRESATVFLSFCDLSSYQARKNPDAVIELARLLSISRPNADIQFVLKVKDAEGDAEGYLGPLRSKHPEILFIGGRMSALETRSLIAASDCVVSLHRAEGFGRTTAEAMHMGRIALATGWSGNLDYMSPSDSLLVNCRLVAIREGEYPDAAGQVWADPDIGHAAGLAARIIDDPAGIARLARGGSHHVRLYHSNRAVGLRVLDRLRVLAPDAIRDAPATNIGAPATAA